MQAISICSYFENSYVVSSVCSEEAEVHTVTFNCREIQHVKSLVIVSHLDFMHGCAVLFKHHIIVLYKLSGNTYSLLDLTVMGHSNTYRVLEVGIECQSQLGYFPGLVP